MSQCIIIFRNTSNQRIDFVSFDEEGDLAVFDDRKAALRAVINVPILKAMPYQIVELDEL